MRDLDLVLRVRTCSHGEIIVMWIEGPKLLYTV